MSNLRTIHNAITGETTTVELSDTEIADRANAVAVAKAQVKAQAAKLLARQAVLDKLGLTADEAAALLG